MFRLLFCINILNLFLFYFLIRHLQSCTSPIMDLICPPKFCRKFVFHFSSALQPSQVHPRRPRGSQSGREKRQDESFPSTGEKRAPGYRLSSNSFQKFKRKPAPDWAPKMLCIIVPNQRTASPEFFS